MNKLEHANLSVTDIDVMTRFILTAFPHYYVRGEGVDDRGRRWRHVGDTNHYLALMQVSGQLGREPYEDSPGMNHLGWEVDDVAALEARLRTAGFTPNLHMDDHPARRRTYFYDPDGNDWEFVQYLTEDLQARHSYA